MFRRSTVVAKPEGCGRPSPTAFPLAAGRGHVEDGIENLTDVDVTRSPATSDRMAGDAAAGRRLRSDAAKPGCPAFSLLMIPQRYQRALRQVLAPRRRHFYLQVSRRYRVRCSLGR